MKMVCTGEANMAFAFSAERKAGHRRAFSRSPAANADLHTKAQAKTSILGSGWRPK